MKSGARRAAYDVLSAVTKDGAYTGLALKKHIPDSLSDEDKKFASLIVRTTLENLIRIDYVLDRFIRSGRVHGSVKNVLRLGACQILFMETENYAAVSESVQLMKQIKPQLSGFVNGVLRALIRGKDTVSFPQGKTAEALSVQYSYPKWICEKYIADFGFDFTESLLSYEGEREVSVRMNTLLADTETFEAELEELNVDYVYGEIPYSYLIKGLSDIEHLALYQKGWMAMQSESAMQAVIQTGVGQGDKLLDCCAAPGGKSAYAAALAGNTLDIVAWDIHAHRVDMTNKNYARLGVKNAKAVLHDAANPEPCLAGRFDVVMVDAPCSAMGLMARNPDIRYNRTLEDIGQLSAIQYELLTTCANYVNVGGTLAYFTCTINREENEEVTGRFISENPGYIYKSAPVTLYPHISRSDGFYIAVMKRKK